MNTNRFFLRGLSMDKTLGQNLKVKNCILHNSVVVAVAIVVVVVASQKIYRRQFLIISSGEVMTRTFLIKL